MLAIPGLGPKTVALLWKEGGVDSVAELKRKIDAGELANLPRMGEKTLANIRRSIEFAASTVTPHSSPPASSPTAPPRSSFTSSGWRPISSSSGRFWGLAR
ncbi:MAG: hypothetical protein HC923_13340 [Myxococcales bacterium]|nr:hypothetical protein [Myxococcales bacterium]